MESNQTTDELIEIWLKISNWCARSEKCAYDVKEKLYHLQVSQAHFNPIINQLEEEGFIDEERYVKAFVHDKVKFNKWGKLKIKFQLNGRQIAPALISRELETVDQKIYDKNLLHHLRFKWQQLLHEDDVYIRSQKVIRYAHSKGFELSDCQNLLEKAIRTTRL